MNLTIVFRELWQSWRASLRRPGFVLLAGLTLALGLGLTVAMFALVDRLVLAPLPYPQSNKLVVIGPTDGAGHFSGLPARWYDTLRDLPALESVGYIVGGGIDANLASPGLSPELVTMLPVSQKYLPVLGVHLALGRNFNHAETARDGPRAVILTYGFWQNHFAGRTDVLGKSLQLNGRAYAIVGVLPRDFRWTQPFDLLVPGSLDHAIGRNENLLVIGRLRTGLTVQQVAAQTGARLRHWLQAHGENESGHAPVSAGLLPVAMVSGYTSISGIVMTCTLAVLLLAAVNVTNLMLQRAVLHGHNQAIRNALGASLLRVALPMLGEGLLIAVLGVAMALGIAQLALAWANATLMRPQWFAFVPHVSLEPRAFVLGTGAGLLVMLVATLLALWRARSSQAVRELVAGGRGGQTVGASRLSRMLVVVQTALGMTLLMVALLFARSQQALAHADLGIRVDHVISATITPPLSLYPDAQALNTLARQVIARIRAIPGVQQVGMLNISPVGAYTALRLQRDSPIVEYVNYQFVQGDPLRALGVPLLRGRLFDRTDHAGAAAVAVVNEAFAQRHMHGNPLGQQVRFDLRAYGLPNDAVSVVGVVGNIQSSGPNYKVPSTIYVPMAQVPPALLGRIINMMHFEARVSAPPATYVNAMRQAVHAVAPEIAVQHVRPLTERVRNFFAPTRVIAEIMVALAVVALLLASLGLYAVVSVDTQARRREWGVRSALGADPPRLIGQVLRRSLSLIVVGTIAGLALGWVLARVVRHLMQFEVVSSVQTGSVAALTVTLVLTTGVLACLAPALRAARTLPVTALIDD